MYEKECQTDFGVTLQGKTAEMEAALRAGQEALMQKEEKVKVLMDQLKIDKQKYDAIREEERLADHKVQGAARDCSSQRSFSEDYIQY